MRPVAPTLALVRSAAYQERPCRLLSYREVKAELDLPPAHDVEWCVSAKGRSCRVFSQLFFEARKLGAIELGVQPYEVTCVRVEETHLSGKGWA